MINLTGGDIFVLISGYFAIRPRANSVVSLFFQGIFYSVGMYALWVLTKQTDFSFGELSMHLKPMKVYCFFGAAMCGWYSLLLYLIAMWRPRQSVSSGCFLLFTISLSVAWSGG